MGCSSLNRSASETSKLITAELTRKNEKVGLSELAVEILSFFGVKKCLEVFGFLDSYQRFFR